MRFGNNRWKWNVKKKSGETPIHFTEEMKRSDLKWKYYILTQNNNENEKYV